MNSLFTPLKKEGLTTLRIRYNWKSDTLKMEALKEWEKDLSFKEYNKAFFADDILTDNAEYLNEKEVRELFAKYELTTYLETVTDLIKEGRHTGIDVMYHAGNDIQLVCHKHIPKAGLYNRMAATYIDGIRRFEPEDDELEMIKEGLNLSSGMSFKLYAAGLPFGGSKTMIKMPELDLNDMETLGFIAYCFDRNGCTTGADMKIPTEIADVMNDNFSMNFTSGPNSLLGESGRPTAYGVYETLRRAVYFNEGTDSLDGKSAVLMGLGAVGKYMAEHLLENDLKLYIADINRDRVENFIKAHPGKDVEFVSVDDALYMDVDILSPCAVGNLFSKDNIDKLKCKYIWGSANNQLCASTKEGQIELAKMLAERGITFEIEWWMNTGGVLCAGHEYKYGDEATYEKLIKQMDENVTPATDRNLKEAKERGITPTENAFRICQEYIYG